MNTLPNWHFKKAKVPTSLVDPIAKELQTLLSLYYDIDKEHNPIQISEENFDNLVKHCPTLKSVLEFSKLSDCFARIVFTISKNINLPMHIDEYECLGDAMFCNYVLNFPVLNCNDTFTTFYDANLTSNYTTEFASESYPDAVYGRKCDETTAKEIARFDSSVPHWMNIDIPHAAEINHNKLRINSSIRFSNDIINKVLIKL